MKVAVLQSNYIPWKGYFDIIHDVDLFLFYDEVQYTKNDWRNRNRILTGNGLKWLTIPCGYDLKRKIYEVKIKNKFEWQKEHYQTIVAAYKKSPFFYKYKELLDYIYLERQWEYLYQLNRYVIETISREFLGIHTIFKDSREYESHGTRDEKLRSLLVSTGCDVYISGSAAKDYINTQLYERNDIKIIWKDYCGYPEYPQRFSSFTHQVSILDLLFNVGDDAPYYIWGWREK